MNRDIIYTNSCEHITAEMLDGGFFVDWPNPPSPEAHLRILKGSYKVWLAIDKEVDKVIGFIHAVSDGVISAYIPLLEVLPKYQGLGIGKEITSKMIESLKHLYMVDVLCDEHLQKYYAKFGMISATGAYLRNYSRQNCE